MHGCTETLCAANTRTFVQAGKSYGSPREALLVSANFLVEQLSALKLPCEDFKTALLAAVSPDFRHTSRLLHTTLKIQNV